MKEKEIHAIVESSAPCPACGRQMGLVRIDDGRCGVIHEHPICARFLDSDPAEYIEYVTTHYDNYVN